MNIAHIANGILTIIGLLTVAIIASRLFVKFIWKIFIKQSFRQQTNNNSQNRKSSIYIPNYIEKHRELAPDLTNKGYTCPTNPIPNLENQDNKPLDKNTLNIVNSPFNEFAPDKVEQLFHSPKSTTRETELKG
jgi:hypothetical protein